MYDDETLFMVCVWPLVIDSVHVRKETPSFFVSSVCVHPPSINFGLVYNSRLFLKQAVALIYLNKRQYQYITLYE